MMKEYSTLQFTQDGPVAKILFNRPEILNRMDDVSTAELVDVIERMRRPGDARVLLFASTGKAFSAGGDLEEVRRLATDKDRRFDAWDAGRRLIYGMMEIPVPTVMALQGDAYGLASSIVLSGDIIVASKNVRIGDPHVRVGLSAGDGGCLLWPAAFGMTKAKRHLLTGDPIGAEEAYRLGGVTDLVDTPEEVLPLAERLAAQITELPPMAVQLTKRALNHAMHKQAVDVFEFSLALEQYGMLSEDLLEAIDAFKNKRPPVYRNR
ncbi:enoyl-CoA hydratase/isomerase family protein [Pseudomonas fluorescens]|uniref:Short-chain-enoyl-CoA hydratase n=1 Tax=Pseudomonas fluorescens TaxID=294 RepID=A0A5E7C0B4_PSEFL|nr:enoyl-CoA hydratase/isomerase family protein [Pseudomonas fluorescens]VVN97769.1 Short-chain-enoyl-CoA hydratase [Pseudomonas fluorescens]